MPNSPGQWEETRYIGSLRAQSRNWREGCGTGPVGGGVGGVEVSTPIMS